MRNKSSSVDKFEEIYAEYNKDIYRVCLAILKNSHLAEDATQETFYKVLKKFNTYNNQSNLKTWITSIAINICKNLLKKKSYKEVSMETISYESPFDDSNQIENKLTILNAVENLSPDLRMVVVLYYYQDLTQKEIAKMLKVPETTVVYRLRKAKEILEDMLKEVYYE